MFACREVEDDEERGHVYHNSKEADKVEKFILDNFRLLKLINVYGFIHVMILVKPM